MTKITRGMVQARVRRILPLIGMRMATSYNDVGGILLDYYHGFQLEKVTNAQGGVSQLLPRRLTAKELDVWLAGAEYGVEHRP